MRIVSYGNIIINDNISEEAANFIKDFLKTLPNHTRWTEVRTPTPSGIVNSFFFDISGDYNSKYKKLLSYLKAVFSEERRIKYFEGAILIKIDENTKPVWKTFGCIQATEYFYKNRTDLLTATNSDNPQFICANNSLLNFTVIMDNESWMRSIKKFDCNMAAKSFGLAKFYNNSIIQNKRDIPKKDKKLASQYMKYKKRIAVNIKKILKDCCMPFTCWNNHNLISHMTISFYNNGYGYGKSGAECSCYDNYFHPPKPKFSKLKLFNRESKPFTLDKFLLSNELANQELKKYNGKFIYGFASDDYEYWVPQQDSYKDFALVRLIRNAEHLITGAKIVSFLTVSPVVAQTTSTRQ